MRKDWETKTWNEVLSIINGKNQKNVEDSNGIYPIYGSGGIMGYANDFLCPNNTVIIGRKGNINKPIFVEEKFWNVDTAFGLVSKEGILSAKYLFFFCVNYNFEKLNKAVTIPSLTKSDLLNIKIDLPPLQTQQQIVEELDCLTSIIEKQKKQLEELDNLAQSIFYDMFGDPIENEKGWNILNLNQIGNFKNGLNFRKHEKGHSIKVLGVGDFKDNKEIRDFKHIETVEISDEISDDYLLKDEDIVFIRSNGSKDLVGRCIIVFPNKQEITFSGFCIRFRRTDDNYISLFLLYLFKNESYKRYYINRSNGCNINNISQTTLSIIPIPSPPLSLQQEFASKIEAIEKQKELIKKSIKETEDLFNSRMDYYFN